MEGSCQTGAEMTGWASQPRIAALAGTVSEQFSSDVACLVSQTFVVVAMACWEGKGM